MSRRPLFIFICSTAVALVGVFGVLAWRAANNERARELSVKVRPRRTVLPGTQEVAIRLDAEAQERMGVIAEPAVLAQHQRRVRLLGLTTTVPHRAVAIRSPWPGTLHAAQETSTLTVGQWFEPGQSVAQLSVQWSPAERVQLASQLAEVQGLIGEGEVEIDVARQTVDRLRTISAEALATKQIIAAAGELARLKARLQALRSREETLREALDRRDVPQRWPLVTPQAGQVTELARRPGEVVSAGDMVAVLYDPSELWVQALVRPGQIPFDQLADQAEITVPGFWSAPLAAHRVQIRPAVDPAQQSLEVVYGCSNPQGRIPVGLQADVLVCVGTPREVLVVPRSAVLQRDDQRLIYLQHGPEEFAKHVVQVEDEDADAVYLRATFPTDLKVVRQGSQVLLSEEFKESIQLLEDSGGSDDQPPDDEQAR